MDKLFITALVLAVLVIISILRNINDKSEQKDIVTIEDLENDEVLTHLCDARNYLKDAILLIESRAESKNDVACLKVSIKNIDSVLTDH